eukprot:g108.t1
MNNLGQTFIYGTKNGSPAFFDIKTGGTYGAVSGEEKKKKRRRKDVRANAHNRETTPSTWIKGCKDGKICYFNVNTKEWRHTPPSKTPGVTTIDVAQQASELPLATAEIAFDSIEPISIDVFDENMDTVDDEMIRAVAKEFQSHDIVKVEDKAEKKQKKNPSANRIVPPKKLQPIAPLGGIVPEYHMSKEELRRARNRESALRSSARRKKKMELAEKKIVELENRVRDLEKILSVRNAQNESLQQQNAFLQSLVREKMA